jgi:hypothetical protein
MNICFHKQAQLQTGKPHAAVHGAYPFEAVPIFSIGLTYVILLAILAVAY